MTEGPTHLESASTTGQVGGSSADQDVEPRLKDSLARLAALGEVPPTDQVGELEEVHRLLHDALSTLDGV